MDNFREDVVTRHNNGLYTFLYYLCWLFMILSGAIALISFYGLYSNIISMISGQASFSVWDLVLFLVFGGCTFLLWRNKDEMRVEYEYTFTNGDLDVSKVLNNSRRKYLTNLPMKIVESCGPVNTNAFNRYLQSKDIKTHNWFLNRGAKLYYFYFTKNNVKHMIIVELTDEMVELVKKPNYMNFGIWQE